MSSVCRLNEYEQAERYLVNAFTQSSSQAVKTPAQELDAKDVALAERFVQLLEKTDPINLEGLEQLLRRKERMMLEEGKGLLDAEDFLQVWTLISLLSLLSVFKEDTIKMQLTVLCIMPKEVDRPNKTIS